MDEQTVVSETESSGERTATAKPVFSVLGTSQRSGMHERGEYHERPCRSILAVR